MASSECPPSAKKLSWTPTRSTPRTSAQIPASTSCTGPSGATNASAGRERSGAGSAARSTLPFADNGNAGNDTNTDGTMYSGNR
ncbi:hypothetical protein, partial [Dactylosporangium siamense]|uniref:hypothetical protein n=1 Tax=Dactylosporangium siamense TaxID=685454 RepID=UPI0036D3E939